MGDDDRPHSERGINGNQLVVRYGVNYEGTDNFLDLALQGGANQYQLNAANYIVSYALSQYNKTQSEASGELLALLTSAGNSSAGIASMADQITPMRKAVKSGLHYGW